MSMPLPATVKLRHADLPDDFFEPDIEHYATWLGPQAVRRFDREQAGERARLSASVQDKKQLREVVAETQGGKLFTGRCSCGQHRCAHLALTLMFDAALTRPPETAAKSKGRPDFAAALKAAKRPERQRGSDKVERAKAPRREREQNVLAFVLLLTRHKEQPTLAVQVRRAEWQGARLQPLNTFRLPYTLRYDTDSIRDLPDYARRDLATLRLLASSAQSAVIEGEEGYYLADSGLGQLLLGSFLETGRLLRRGQTQPLRAGETLSPQISWHTDPQGMQRLIYQPPEGVERLPLPGWYLRGNELGKLQSALSPEAEARLLSLAPMRPEESRAFAEVAPHLLGAEVPPPPKVEVREETLPYRPLLRLSYRVPQLKRAGGRPASAEARALAELLHLYGDQAPPLSGHITPTRHYQDGELRILQRDPASERAAEAQLSALGFVKLAQLLPPSQKLSPADSRQLLTLPSEQAWFDFMERGVRQLEARGVRVEVPEDFPYRLATIEDWYGETEEGAGWFTLDLGVVVGSEKVSLLPLLSGLIAARPDLFEPRALAALDDKSALYVALPDGRKLPLPAGRVRNIISILVELNLPQAASGPLKLPLLDAGRLAELESSLKARWVGARRLLALGNKLRDFSGIAQVKPPRGLRATLRPYQRQGLSWLQFLRETEIGGILADDMGLGKTLQTLAHIQLEKEAGRADLPSLVVAPTSVLHNWQREAERFTPDLKVLTLRGPARKAQFAHLADYDLVLTSYPLLPRDLSALERQPFHLLILDEAQNIKNAKSASARAAGGLQARHRLALTGTPLENHLGELWSLFHFLSPGLLHSEKVFRELYRTPIEKRGDVQRQRALSARIRPFVLRREKAQVARELPPKTEIPVRVSLEGDQRDLYETVRVTMQDKVHRELRSRGLARSTVAILDALLKLRQAATDPRLVKLSAASAVKHNAKLSWFNEHIPKLVEEGRRILVFSAFATLLGHLEESLKQSGVAYSKLTGQTRLREAQINAFQSGQTQVFLISLKAGGVGLNLTAADTVIHYDPWWNPAAEQQATDRAYRIGQDKPVFVYKLLAAGSVEERILEMQQRKAALAQGVLEGGLSDASQLSPSDLERLFAPLEEEGSP